MRQVFSGAKIFDGTHLLADHALVVEDGLVVAIEPGLHGDTKFSNGVIMPAFIDLKVNGGGGIMLDGLADAGRIAAVCATHILQGCVGCLPTLFTDTKAATQQVIRAGIEAGQANVPGFLGLHLEGPHLEVSRKGAHDPLLIRPMDAEDLEMLLEAKRSLQVLKVTMAPSSVTLDQVSALAKAGVIVSLGHSQCSYDVALDYIAAGARCATHLFNAMAPIRARETGLAGAVLDTNLPASIISDGVHVSPAALRLAMAARPEGVFLISDSMAFAGTELKEIVLGGRRVRRDNARLTLDDGTLAGTDLRLDRALAILVGQVGVAPEKALAMATSTPAALIGMEETLGHLLPGRSADMVYLDADWQLGQIWWGGVSL